MSFQPNPRVFVFFEPQFTKIWGEPQYSGNSATTNVKSATSGAAKDTPLDVHQAFVKYSPRDELNFSLGRRELNYGDQLVLGGVGWSNIGRSFDLGMGSYTYGIGTVDAFQSKLVDQNTATAGAGDKNLTGIYSSNKVSDELQNADLYFLDLSDSTTSPPSSTAAYGLRLKSPIFNFLDYRLEFTQEKVKNLGKSSDENQIDIEAGTTLLAASKTRLAAEFFKASRNYNQLFPTAHKWLGYADLFGRRNIEGFRVGVSSEVLESLKLSLDYHSFSRSDVSNSAYKVDGSTAYGTGGAGRPIASEIDLVATYKLDLNVDLEAGAAQVSPDKYMKANAGSDISQFYYVQVGVSF
jgi:hypothetical protein